MAHLRKFATLPDLDDTAQDIYETTVTRDATSPTHSRSTSVSSTYDDLDEEDEGRSGVDRHRVRPDEARSQFRSARVDARNVDFSDRIGPGQRSYRVSNRRRRKGRDAFESGEYGNEDGGEEESYSERLARLKREVEEMQEQARSRYPDAEQEGRDDISELSRAMRDLQTQPIVQQDRSLKQSQNMPKPVPIPQPTLQTSGETLAETNRVLSKATALEQRLTSLELALGTNSNPLSSNRPPNPILPTLSVLESQLQTLQSTSSPSLEALQKHIRQLTLDSEALADARDKARKAGEAAAREAMLRPLSGDTGSFGSRPGSGGGSGAVNGHVDGATLALAQDAEQAHLVQRLYASLTTIEDMAPLLPLTIERLKSLRVLHENAAVAEEDLVELERRQGDMGKEIARWREGVEKVEVQMGKAGEVEKGNKDAVEAWVRALERKVEEMQ